MITLLASAAASLCSFDKRCVMHYGEMMTKIKSLDGRLLRHATALALMGWFLMIPPLFAEQLRLPLRGWIAGHKGTIVAMA